MQLNKNILDKIALTHGQSFYIIEPDKFTSNFKKLQDSFSNYYPNTKIAYSYKTNYVPTFCKKVDQLGGYAEVVSSMELELAVKIGVNPHNIFFNGPFKDWDCLENYLRQGITVNVDSYDELQKIVAYASTLKSCTVKIGIRCNFDVHDGVLSRFGFDVTENSFAEIINLVDESKNVKLSGLHCHFATRSLECWKNRTQGMLNVIDRFFKHRIQDLSHISLGGGMYGPMPDELKVQFPVHIPDFSEYASVAAASFSNFFKDLNCKQKPCLIIEPGTAIVADAMKYVCKVVSIKKVRDRTFISLNGSSYNISPNSNSKNVPIEVFSDDANSRRISVDGAYLCGYTCIEGDYLHTNFNGDVGVNDFIVFDDVGSYSVVMKPPFILPNVSIIEIHPEQLSFKLIKKRETFDDVFSTYTFV